MTDACESVIEISRLTKRYGSTTAIENLSLTVADGSIHGFLGPNGAGKTTTIRALLGFIRPTGGSSRVFGHDAWTDGLAARARLGYLVPPDALYQDMSGRAQLDLAARLAGRRPVLRDRLLEGLELDRKVLRQRLGTFSRGMRQKLALIVAMQTDPDLLILDEPTDGLDPLIRRNFEALVRERHAQGRTIFMSSHDLEEVERLCQRVAIVRAGRLVAEESVPDLMRRRLRVWEVTFVATVPDEIERLPGVHVSERDGRRLRFTVQGQPDGILAVLGRHDVQDLTVTPPRLEDVFFGFYGDDRDQRPMRAILSGDRTAPTGEGMV